MVTDLKAIKTLEEKEGKDFDGSLPPAYELQDELGIHSLALFTLAELLYSSPLDNFADEDLGKAVTVDRDEQADNLRFGIQKLIELWLAEQARIVNKHRERVEGSYYYQLKNFEDRLGVFKKTKGDDPILFRSLMEQTSRLDRIIEGSEEFRDRALAAKKEVIEFRDRALAELKAKEREQERGE